jgi:hypothetical protein
VGLAYLLKPLQDVANELYVYWIIKGASLGFGAMFWISLSHCITFSFILCCDDFFSPLFLFKVVFFYVVLLGPFHSFCF